jgi:hypothetical protein
LLYYAVANNNIGNVKILLQRVADVNRQSENGIIPLHCAIIKDNLELVRVLLENGADVNRQDSGGNTALILAMNKDMPGLTEILLARGADPTRRDGRGYTPFWFAVNSLLCKNNKTNTNNVKILLQHGANIMIPEANLNVGIYNIEFSKYIGFPVKDLSILQSVALSGKIYALEVLISNVNSLDVLDRYIQHILDRIPEDKIKDVLTFLQEKRPEVEEKERVRIEQEEMADRVAETIARGFFVELEDTIDSFAKNSVESSLNH